MTLAENIFPSCHYPELEKGTALGGRRAYHCCSCGSVWIEGMRRPGREFPTKGANLHDPS
jgi:hypothetical protein